ncbi:hypothetical protein MBANPS3_012333, partial [Mucor bainieri]
MADIGNIVGWHKSTVQSITERIKTTGTPMPGHSTGAPKKLIERDERLLKRVVRKDPFLSSFEHIIAESALSQINISKPTLVCYLDAQGFKSYFAAHKPRFTPKHHIDDRLRWAKER